ncbi:MAG: hypothetical protein A3J29_10595 [Acidobacteria bacterium RIFCSPLOWO2_12_FULL_67_14b]|nr:MAG: hypothetical protein A3J29_10595 [Acidobacteria bacterium RIFCSPLOWO2_12_FULL_67_14b]
MHASEPLPHFVDDYLDHLYEVHPTGATMDGVHAHDDLVEDYRRTAVDAHVSALAGFARRLDAIPSAHLPLREQVEHEIVAANIRARQFELEEARSWERNPHVYAETMASSLAAQAIFAYAPEAERARRVLSKLRQVPRLVQAARDNIKDPPAIFVKVGIDTWRGTMSFIDTDLPRAFSSVDDLHLLSDLADACHEAVQTIGAYVTDLETEVRPKAKGSFRLGRERFERKLRLDEGITLPVDRLLAIAMRELAATQDEFRTLAGRLNGADPVAAWRAAKQTHPEPGTLISTARQQLDELHTFLSRNPVVAMPESAGVTVAATPDFFRWSSASMWTPGPFEAKPSRALYYLTDVDQKWEPARKVEHLRDFNLPTLWTISIHEVYPGHFLHYQHLRRVDSKVRRSTMFAPASYMEGWAHYCEQMMIEAGFGKGDHALKLGQLAEALVRLARFVVGIRLHTEDWSVEQGVRFFRDEAFLEEPNARREAERGTFDPTYLVYSAGKLMLLKLRRDWYEQQGGKPGLRAFHDALLSHGAAPFWALRRLMLDGPSDVVLE